MNRPAGSRAGDGQSTGRKTSPARQALGLVLLVVLAGVGVVEWNTRRQAVRAVETLEARLADEGGGLLSQTEVEAIVGRPPSGPLAPAEAEQLVGTYIWKGLFRSTTVDAHYGKTAGEPYLLRIETR